MAEPFMGQIMQVGFTFAPRGWAFCAGQQIAVSQSTALFSLLGTNFGGNGVTTFGLPNAQGRALVGVGQGLGTSNYKVGEMVGSESMTLLISNMPAHTHTAAFQPSGSQSVHMQAMTGIAGSVETAAPAEGSFLGTASEPDTAPKLYVPAGTTGGTAVNLGGCSLSGPAGGTVTVGVAGGSQAFSLLQPLLAVNTIISMEGIFPSRN
jgi:microcystin-dependent protein